MKREKSATSKEPRTERDQGYGESHGYAPGHGGPSGPGDVPADETAQGPAHAPPSREVDADGDTKRPGETAPGQAS